jgi:hypothetical protein
MSFGFILFYLQKTGSSLFVHSLFRQGTTTMPAGFFSTLHRRDFLQQHRRITEPIDFLQKGDMFY